MNKLLELSRFLSVVIDSKSRFTSLHSCGVASVAKKLASYIGWDDHELTKISIAGYLHDIGKLSVPQELLEHDGPLSPDQWHYIKPHSFHTYQILKKVPGLEEVSIWAANHHEKINGSGYPNKLSGDEICTGSRILAISDIFSAISEERPYRKGMQKHEVCDLLSQQVSDGDLDEKLVAILIENYDSISLDFQEARRSESEWFNTFWSQDYQLN